MDQLETRACQGKAGAQAPQVPLVQQVVLGSQGFQEPMEHQAHLEAQELQGPLEPLE